MAAAYSKAWCNIAAAGAINGRTGCLFDRNAEDIQPVMPKTPLKDRALSMLKFNRRRELAKQGASTVPPFSRDAVFLDHSFWSRGVIDTGIAQRCWGLQERLLAKRVIYFTESQIFFEFRQFQAYETFPQGLPKSDG
jgi:hypothetical protein